MARRALLVTGGAVLVAGCAAPAAAPLVTGRFDPARRIGPTLWEKGLRGYRFDRLVFAAPGGTHRYRLWLAWPVATAPAPAAGHPLLCMLDGNAVADTLRAADLEALVSAGRAPVVAALGSDSELRFDVDRRAYDYTPAVRFDGPTWDDEARGRRGGGADAFLDLWAEQVLPRIGQCVATDARRRTLWGHSYGGLFVLHALLRRPALFTRYAAADASLWWQEGAILREAQQPAPLPAGRETTLLFMQGDTTGQPSRTSPTDADAARMARMQQLRAAVSPDSGERLVAQLRQRPGLRAEYLAFPGVSHGPMFSASIPPALALAASPVLN